MTDEIHAPKIRRLGVEHWTEHDFEMERIGREQDAETYRKRLETLESYGFKPFRGPYYYGGREWHGGHHPPGTRKRVPTKVAFAMLLEEHPEIELEPWKSHPHGWTPPPSTQGLVHQELVKVEPMKAPAFSLLTEVFEHGTEEKETRREEQDRLDALFKEMPGVRRYGTGRGGKFLLPYFWVVLEGEEYRAQVPDAVDGVEVRVEIKSEANERAEKKARRAKAEAKRREEAEWLKKAREL